MAIECLENIIKYPRAVLKVLFVLINNIYCIPTYLMWMLLLLPLKKIHPETYYRIEGRMFHWLLANVSMWSAMAGYDLVETGDDITSCLDQRTLVLVNHQSTADVPLLMSLFNTKQEVLPNVMWIMDKLFKYTNFGAVSMLHQDFFIGSGRRHREEALVQLKAHIKKSYLPRQRKWMILFPEGGFLRKRREASQRYAQKNNLPILEYVTIPRVGALKTIMESLTPVQDEVLAQVNFEKEVSSKTEKDKLNQMKKSSSTENDDQFYIDNEYNNRNSAQSTPLTTPPQTPVKQQILNNNNSFDNSERKLKEQEEETGDENLKENLNKLKELSFDDKATSNYLKYILDITVAYPNRDPLDLGDIVTGLRKPCHTNLLYRLYRCSEVPEDEESLTKWLYDRFIEKEELLKNYYQTGSFSYPAEIPPTVVQQDILRYLIIHLFFITSTYFHFQMFYMLFTYINSIYA